MQRATITTPSPRLDGMPHAPGYGDRVGRMDGELADLQGQLDGVSGEYAEQVTAEHKVNVRSGEKNVLTWVQKNSHGDNHYLDCEVYSAAAADILGVRELYLEDIAQAPVPSEPAPTSEENWIQEHENWI